MQETSILRPVLSPDAAMAFDLERIFSFGRPNFDTMVDAGLQAFHAGDWAQARYWWGIVARQNERLAPVVLYNYGLACERDPDSKINGILQGDTYSSYIMSAKAGFAPAQNSLGVLFLKGKFVARDPVAAAHHFQLAADQGYVRGQYNLALCYLRGVGLEKDVQKAHDLLMQVADKGCVKDQNGHSKVERFHINALRLLAENYENGTFDSLSRLEGDKLEAWRHQMAKECELTGAELRDPHSALALSTRLRRSGDGEQIFRAAQLYEWVAEQYPEIARRHVVETVSAPGWQPQVVQGGKTVKTDTVVKPSGSHLTLASNREPVVHVFGAKVMALVEWRREAAPREQPKRRHPGIPIGIQPLDPK